MGSFFMYYKNITTSGATNIYAGKVREVLIQANAALTGTIIISDETSTAGSPLVATITNPTVGSQYIYRGLQNGVTVNASTTCDVTVSLDLSFVGK